MKVKKIVSILPRVPWPPYAGQSRLSYYRNKQLKRMGYKTILIYINLFPTFKKDFFPGDISKAYDTIYPISINLFILGINIFNI